jgi:hypothetical protein
MRSPERALLKRAVMIQMVRIKIPSGGSGAAEHYCELWPDVNPLPGECIPLGLGQHFPRPPWTACQGVCSHPLADPLVGECSIPVV